MSNMSKEMAIRNPAAIAEFENRTDVSARSIGAEMVVAREAQEVQVAMAAAKRFPRDPVTAYNRIMADCSRKSLAERAMYEFPRGGTMVTGASIHLAKALARGWGNLKSGFRVLESTPTQSTVEVFCHDLESNYSEVKTFTVQHVRETRKGNVPLTDPRDIYEMVANQAARRERSCILSVIPADVVDAAVEQCKITLCGDNKMPLIDMVRALVKNFGEQYGVTAEQLEAFVGCKKEAFSLQSVIRLKNVYNTIRDGSASVDQYFGEQAAPAKPKPPARMPEPPQSVAPEPAAEPEGAGLDDL